MVFCNDSLAIMYTLSFSESDDINISDNNNDDTGNNNSNNSSCNTFLMLLYDNYDTYLWWQGH